MVQFMVDFVSSGKHNALFWFLNHQLYYQTESCETELSCNNSVLFIMDESICH